MKQIFCRFVTEDVVLPVFSCPVLWLRANFNLFCRCVFVKSWFLDRLNAFYFLLSVNNCHSHMTHSKAWVLEFLAAFSCWFSSFVFYVLDFSFYYAYYFQRSSWSRLVSELFILLSPPSSLCYPSLTFTQLFGHILYPLILHLIKPKLGLDCSQYQHLCKTSGFSLNSAFCLMM